jgi:hypothetical protein
LNDTISGPEGDEAVLKKILDGGLIIIGIDVEITAD